MTKTEAAVYKAAMRRYRQWAKEYPVYHAQIIAKKYDLPMTDAGQELVRACAADAKAKKKGREKK